MVRHPCTLISLATKNKKQKRCHRQQITPRPLCVLQHVMLKNKYSTYFVKIKNEYSFLIIEQFLRHKVCFSQELRLQTYPLMNYPAFLWLKTWLSQTGNELDQVKNKKLKVHDYRTEHILPQAYIPSIPRSPHLFRLVEHHLSQQHLLSQVLVSFLSFC